MRSESVPKVREVVPGPAPRLAGRVRFPRALVEEMGRCGSPPSRRRRLGSRLSKQKGPVAGVDIDIRPTRLVVIGDTTFAVNNSLVGGNPDLFLNAINWLLDRQTLLSIAAKPVQDVRLVMDRRQLSLLFAAVVVAMPALVALAGALMWLRRRT